MHTSNVIMKLTESDKDLLAECYRSTKIFSKTFFPETFYVDFDPYIHNKIFELIDSDAPRVAIAAPRGTGKTSISRAKAAKDIAYSDSFFLPWISVSETGATQQTENLKRDLATNDSIKKFFGRVKGENASDMDEAFSKKSWVAYNQTLVMPRGCGQQIRGILFGHHRPDLLIIDDLEHPDEVKSDELREQRKDWFWADLMKCISRFSKNYKIIYIDTLKHEASLLQDLLDSSDWESVRLEICDDNIETRAPNIMPQEELNTEYESHKEKGKLDIFYREYRNLPTAGEDASFQQNYFRYYYEENLNYREIENVVIVDPAKTTKMHSAESAIVGVGINQQNGSLLVRDIVANKLHPDELYDEAIKMAIRLGARAIAVEVTSLNEFISQPLKNEMARRGLYSIEFVELHARGGRHAEAKEKRVAALVPYYRQGLIFHNPNNCAALEAQLLSYPRSKRWDIMDALAYIVELMDIGSRYFDPPEDEIEEPDDEDVDIESLEWRVI